MSPDEFPDPRLTIAEMEDYVQSRREVRKICLRKGNIPKAELLTKVIVYLSAKIKEAKTEQKLARTGRWHLTTARG